MTWSPRALVVGAAVILAIAGCGTSNDAAAIQRWTGPVAELRLGWDAEPGIDVLTGASVPIRAFVESMLVAQYAGNLDYAYPGFARAVPDDSPGDVWSRRPLLDGARTVPLVGTERYRILSVTRDGRTVTATLCNYNYAVGIKQSDGQFVSAGRTGVGEARGVSALRVGLIAPQGDGTQLPPQAGPQPAPNDDVFGDWQVRGLLNFFVANKPGFAAAWPTYDADVANCVARAPASVDRRNFLIDGQHPRTDFPTSSASPGWPATG